MKTESKKILPITIAIIVTSIFTITFCVLSFFNNDADIWTFRNFMFSILRQVGLCITMILSGANTFFNQKQKVLGAFLWLASGVTLFVLIDTINVGLQEGII